MINRKNRVLAGLITLGTVIFAAGSLSAVKPWVAAILGLLLALITYAALGVASRGRALSGLHGRRLQIYFGVLGVAMGLFGALPPFLPEMEVDRMVSIVLLVCAALYIGTALVGFGRPRRPYR